MCVTVQKPNIVLVDESKKSLHLFKLICHMKDNINKRHLEKTIKYAQIETDLSSEHINWNLT